MNLRNRISKLEIKTAPREKEKVILITRVSDSKKDYVIYKDKEYPKDENLSYNLSRDFPSTSIFILR